MAAIVGREAELEGIGAFFDSEQGVTALWLEGAGIGKTTLWRAGLELGRARGRRVLSCVPTESETVFSYAALGDLLSPVVAPGSRRTRSKPSSPQASSTRPPSC